jgi:hypothetical protein
MAVADPVRLLCGAARSLFVLETQVFANDRPARGSEGVRMD